jgi:hypothetical protein
MPSLPFDPQFLPEDLAASIAGLSGSAIPQEGVDNPVEKVRSGPVKPPQKLGLIALCTVFGQRCAC